jgi:hypothetical protein
MSRPCPLCEGHGCEECDQTGKRYRESFEINGVPISVSGSGDGLKPELREAFALLARLVSPERTPGGDGGESRCGRAEGDWTSVVPPLECHKCGHHDMRTGRYTLASGLRTTERTDR